MITNKILVTLLSGVASLAFLSSEPALCQVQTTGVVGSPSATTTIEGNKLPPPPPNFGGVINESYTDSKPWWPPRVAIMPSADQVPIRSAHSMMLWP